MKDPSSRLGRWALKLQEYQYNVIHKDGKNNKHADALSRRPYDDSGTPVTTVTTTSQEYCYNAYFGYILLYNFG